MLLFSEDITTVSREYARYHTNKLPLLSHLPRQIPATSVIAFRDQFKHLSVQRLEELRKDPFSTVVLFEGKVISAWFSFYLKLARDLEVTV
jgi:hypothetical protein